MVPVADKALDCAGKEHMVGRLRVRLVERAAFPRTPHEEMLARSPFRYVHRLVYEFTRAWTIEQTIGYLYSTSLPLRRLLGDRRAVRGKLNIL